MSSFINDAVFEETGTKILISESVRGEGAILLNKDGERFVDELLPRDMVTGAIRKQMEKDGTDHVWLSMEQIDRDTIRNHFPNIYQHCLAEGYDVTKTGFRLCRPSIILWEASG